MTKSELLNEQDHNKFVKVLRAGMENENNRILRNYISIFISGITVGVLLSTSLLLYIFG